MSTALMLACAHDWSRTGAEGPIRDLGRFPILWTCDVCGTLLLNAPGWQNGSR